MRAYLYDNVDENIKDQYSAHDSGKPVSLDELARLGVEYQKIGSMDIVNELAAARSYRNRDIVNIVDDKTPAYKEKTGEFFKEHLHEDEEIRYILEGKGYFDVRDKADRWIRIFVEQHDLLILPAGIYHRFTPDNDGKIHALRLFKEEPKWLAMKRTPEVDANRFRKEYIKTFLA